MKNASWELSSAWDLAGWTMLHYLWVGGVLWILAATGRRMLLRFHPDVRYGYALASLSILAVAPAVIAWFLSSAPPMATRPPRITGNPRAIVAATSGIGRPSRGAVAVTATLTPAAEPTIGNPSPLHSSGTFSRLVAKWLDALATALPVLWLMGAPITFAYLTAGLVGVERLPG